MTRKRDHAEFSQRRDLESAGWRVEKGRGIRPNDGYDGTENDAHFFVKCVVGWHLIQNGYRVDSEVSKDGVGEIDVIGYGKAGGPPIAVECETDLTQNVRETKLEQFYHNEPFAEVYLLEVNKIPTAWHQAREYVQNELGGEL